MEPIKIPYNTKTKFLLICILLILVIVTSAPSLCEISRQLFSDNPFLIASAICVTLALAIIIISTLFASIPFLIIMSFTPLTITEEGIKFYYILIPYKNITHMSYNPKHSILTLYCDKPLLKNQKKDTVFPLFLSFFKITPKDLLQLLPSTIPVEEDRR